MNDTDNQQERLVDLAWIAGIYEGEGNFTLGQGSGHRIMPRAHCINTDFKLIEAVTKSLKRLRIGHYVTLRKGGCSNNPRHSDAKVIITSGVKRVNTFLVILLPYLRGKKKEIAKHIVAYTERRLSLPHNAPYTAEDFAAVKAVRALNKKGPQESSETTRWSLDWLSTTRDGNQREDIVQVA